MSRWLQRFVVLTALCLAAPLLAQDTDSIVAAAIQAQGGEERLEKLKAARVKAKGTVFAGPGRAETAFTLEDCWQAPDQYKTILKFQLNGAAVTQIQVITGDQGWISFNGQVQALPKPALDEMKEQKYAEDLDRLLILKDDRHKLSVIPEQNVAGRPVVGLKVQSEGHRDVSLLFDKETHLLVKREQEVMDDSGKLVKQEIFFRDYRSQDGLKLCSKIVAHRDGAMFLEADVTEYAFPDKIDAEEFRQP